METVTVNEKGQITIPSKMRKALGIRPGNHVRLFSEPGHEASFIVSKTGSIMDAFGMFATNSKKVSTIQEMDESKEKAVAEHVMFNDKS